MLLLVAFNSLHFWLRLDERYLIRLMTRLREILTERWCSLRMNRSLTPSGGQPRLPKARLRPLMRLAFQ